MHDVSLIPFEQIDRSPLNPRKIFDAATTERLAESIAALGIQQNLVARPHPKKPGRFELAAGERRWRAVQLLVSQELWRPGDPLPVKVVELDDAALLENALVENLQRDSLHPLDEAEGYTNLIAAGRSIAQVAAAVPFTKRHVELRLQLAANLHDKLKRAFREDGLNLAQARVLAAYAEPKRQVKVLERIRAGDYHYETAEDIKDQLTRDAIPLGAEIFEPTLYKGPWIEDPDEPGQKYYADVEAFAKLQTAAIEARAAELKETYAWVEVQHGNWFSAYNYGHTNRKALAGAVIFVKPDRSVEIHTGLLSPADRKKLDRDSRAKGKGETKTKDADDPTRFLPTKAGLAMAKLHKTHALRAALLAAGPEMAMRLACLALLGQDGEVRLHRASVYDMVGDHIETPAVEAVVAAQTRGLKGLRGVRSAGLLESLLALDKKALHPLFVALIARCLGTYPGSSQLGDSEMIAALAKAMPPDVTQHWSLGEDYLGCCGKRGLLLIAVSLGVTAPSGKTGWPRAAGELEKLRLNDLRATILAYVKDHPDAKVFLPFPFHFGSPKALLAKAVLPKPKIEAKPRAKKKAKAAKPRKDAKAAKPAKKTAAAKAAIAKAPAAKSARAA